MYEYSLHQIDHTILIPAFLIVILWSSYRPKDLGLYKLIDIFAPPQPSTPPPPKPTNLRAAPPKKMRPHELAFACQDFLKS